MKIDQKVNEAASILHLEEYLDRKPKTLSGGQRQTLAIARALETLSYYYLMNQLLDFTNIKHVVKSISEINETGVSILLVEQNAKRALSFCDRGYVLDQGKNSYTGTGDDLLDDPKVIDLYLGKL